MKKVLQNDQKMAKIIFAVLIILAFVAILPIYHYALAIRDTGWGYGYFSNYYSYGYAYSSDSPSAPSSFSCSSPTASTIACTWTAPTTSRDGQSLNNLSSYEVYYSTSAGVSSSGTLGGSPTLAYATVSGLSPSTAYYLTVYAIDDNGNRGVAATEVSVTTLASGGGAGGGSGTVPVAQPKAGETTVSPTAGGMATATTSEGATLSVSVPAGAVTTAATITVSPAAASSAAAPGAGYFMVGESIFQITSTGSTTFSKELTLTFSYTNAQLSTLGLDESSLKVYWYDTTKSAWVALTTTVNTANNTLTATVSHLTNFAVMGQRAATTVADLDGQLLRTKLNSAVYYVAKGSTVRQVFPDAATYFSWFTDFSGVKEVSTTEIAKYTLGKNMTYKPGSLIKITSVPKVYLVGSPNTIGWVVDEVTFKRLGYSFSNVHDVAVSYFGDYIQGANVQ